MNAPSVPKTSSSKPASSPSRPTAPPSSPSARPSRSPPPSRAACREGQDFFPLQVDYREKTYAAGKFPGGFIKREGRPTTKEILTSRLIDRPIRPLFPAHYFNEVQIMTSALSADRENDPDVLCMIGASAALHLSQIPFLQPTGSVRIGRVGGELIVMPTHSQLEESDLDLIVSGTRKAITMIEGFAARWPRTRCSRRSSPATSTSWRSWT